MRTDNILSYLFELYKNGLPAYVHVPWAVLSLALYAFAVYHLNKDEGFKPRSYMIVMDLSWKGFFIWLGVLSLFLYRLIESNRHRIEIFVLFFYFKLPLVVLKEFKRKQEWLERQKSRDESSQHEEKAPQASMLQQTKEDEKEDSGRYRAIAD